MAATVSFRTHPHRGNHETTTAEEDGEILPHHGYDDCSNHENTVRRVSQEEYRHQQQQQLQGRKRPRSPSGEREFRRRPQHYDNNRERQQRPTNHQNDDYSHGPTGRGEASSFQDKSELRMRDERRRTYESSVVNKIQEPSQQRRPSARRSDYYSRNNNVVTEQIPIHRGRDDRHRSSYERPFDKDHRRYPNDGMESSRERSVRVHDVSGEAVRRFSSSHGRYSQERPVTPERSSSRQHAYASSSYEEGISTRQTIASEQRSRQDHHHHHPPIRRGHEDMMSSRQTVQASISRSYENSNRGQTLNDTCYESRGRASSGLYDSSQRGRSSSGVYDSHSGGRSSSGTYDGNHGRKLSNGFHESRSGDRPSDRPYDNSGTRPYDNRASSDRSSNPTYESNRGRRSSFGISENSNDRRSSNGRQYDISRDRGASNGTYDNIGRPSHSSTLGKSSSSHSARSWSSQADDVGTNSRHRERSDTSWSRQPSLSEQNRPDGRADVYRPSPSVDSIHRQQLRCRESSDHSRLESSVPKDRWSGPRLNDAEAESRRHFGSSAPRNNTQELVYLKEPVVPLHGYQNYSNEVNENTSRDERGCWSDEKPTGMDEPMRRNSYGSASQTSNQSHCKGHSLPTTPATTTTPQWSKTVVRVQECVFDVPSQESSKKSPISLLQREQDSSVVSNKVESNQQESPPSTLSRSELLASTSSISIQNQSNSGTDEKLTNEKKEVNKIQNASLQPSAKTVSPAASGKSTLTPILSIPSRWLKPKVIKRKEPIKLTVKAAETQVDALQSIPRRDSLQGGNGIVNKKDSKVVDKETSIAAKEEAKSPNARDLHLQTAKSKVQKGPVKLTSISQVKKPKASREEPGATPDLLDAPFSSPERPSEEKTEFNGATIVSEDDGIMVETPPQRRLHIHLSAKSVAHPSSYTKTEAEDHEIYEPDDDASTSDSSTSSDDSETDDEELMEWAQKMFGVPGAVSCNVDAPIGGDMQSSHAKGKTPLLKLKLRLPGPKEMKAARKASKSRRKKVRREGIHEMNSCQLVTDEEAKLAAEQNRQKKEFAKPLTAAEVAAILADDDADYAPSTWVRRSTRQPSRSVLTSPKVRSLLEKLKLNDPDMVVLKMKKYLSDPDAPPAALDIILDALEENSNCEALYIQNFNQGMRDEQVLHLLKILQLPTCRIWCLNIGETYNVSTKTWTKFATGLKDTKVTHMYASEHTISNELKDDIRETIRLNRRKHDMHCNPNNLDTIILCTHCWWNPINTKSLRPYLKNRGFEHMLHDPEQQGLRGSTSGAPA